MSIQDETLSGHHIEDNKAISWNTIAFVILLAIISISLALYVHLHFSKRASALLSVSERLHADMKLADALVILKELNKNTLQSEIIQTPEKVYFEYPLSHQWREHIHIDVENEQVNAIHFVSRDAMRQLNELKDILKDYSSRTLLLFYLDCIWLFSSLLFVSQSPRFFRRNSWKGKCPVAFLLILTLAFSFGLTSTSRIFGALLLLI